MTGAHPVTVAPLVDFVSARGICVSQAHLLFSKLECMQSYKQMLSFSAPAWKVRWGHLEIGSSVCLSICLSFRNSVPLTNKVQYLKFGWWYSKQTWTVSSSIGCSHFTDITCPLGWGGVKMKDFEIFAIFWLCCRRGHLNFTNTFLVYIISLCNLYCGWMSCFVSFVWGLSSLEAGEAIKQIQNDSLWFQMDLNPQAGALDHSASLTYAEM